MDKIGVMLAMNDIDTGNITDIVDVIQFDDLIKLDGYGCVCRLVGPNKLKVSRRHFPILDFSYWVGNWCWNEARMDIETASDLLNYLCQSGNWNVCEAVSGLFEAFQNQEPIVLKEWPR